MGAATARAVNPKPPKPPKPPKAVKAVKKSGAREQKRERTTRSRAEQGINTALLVSVAEACRLLCVKHKALYRLMDRGDLAYVHIGRYRRIPLWSLEDLAGMPPTRRTIVIQQDQGTGNGNGKNREIGPNVA